MSRLAGEEPGKVKNTIQTLILASAAVLSTLMFFSVLGAAYVMSTSPHVASTTSSTVPTSTTSTTASTTSSTSSTSTTSTTASTTTTTQPPCGGFNQKPCGGSTCDPGYDISAGGRCWPIKGGGGGCYIPAGYLESWR
ncbi:MAG: hypothetical protein GF416_02790 [Candidatus Altiarchaeales archaeon]|nr:hypothetical protein [Candidatus Altiarchaeales archaeon]MBD3416046.1 hypothetical protein [Candidatus Altiarchaeales archaeon]